MSRTALIAPIDLDAYKGELTVAQVCQLVSDAGLILEARTLHRWIKIGLVPAHHPHTANREWRIKTLTAKLIIGRLARLAKRAA